ncbi:cysteine dioxygenase [Pseudomonas sp. CCI3.2]|uniref:cysteine dioxygenase family protein n=2 Tax=Pseudomonas TaxID=286 RepID=UPI002AC95E14|nr:MULTISPECIES: cysteine dioxygenase [unclassified Pseudomonas]MEB0079518.1 cysteine dioxygenase [Pseudomonas sp. MH10out]MEB0102457.1 cysteine dioxygenase [Pseudomonas sp. CCI3.2]MEB0132489.1 cysteine dioxygenase [Pseudomonas sp. CCI2.4]MEB0159261.1 cysteine dioxygenase [Pseudomonas sp. AH2 (2023)]MEB0169126.1 cysteine dioxygenase [Pseudomonas sp. CCC4.4]
MTQTRHPERLRAFIGALAELIDSNPSEGDLLHRGGKLLSQLVSVDDWLPDDYATPDPQHYQQFLLHADSRQRFCVVSFVWGPGQRTPIHDHRVWGLIGMLRGAEFAQGYARTESGRLEQEGPAIRLEPGHVEALSPRSNDIHQVSNAFNDRVSISIHVYGANIGAVKRAVYQPDGSEKLFISGYSNTLLPNIWDLSKEGQHP